MNINKKNHLQSKVCGSHHQDPSPATSCRACPLDRRVARRYPGDSPGHGPTNSGVSWMKMVETNGKKSQKKWLKHISTWLKQICFEQLKNPC